MKRKNFLTAFLVVMMTMAMSMTAFAAGWQKNDTGWWYATNADNTAWHANGWQWIDGNGDGVAECYYFDGNGYMLANTTTPDGYMVNADGAWMENGAVQTKQVEQVPQDTATGVPSTSEYNENGISLAAMDMINGNRESNKKYGEVAVYGNPDDEYGVEYVVKYANGISVEYYPFYYGTDASEVWIYTRENYDEGDYVTDGEKIFRDVEDFPDADTAAQELKNKGYQKVATNGISEVHMVADHYQVQIEFRSKKVAAVNLAKTSDHPDKVNRWKERAMSAN